MAQIERAGADVLGTFSKEEAQAMRLQIVTDGARQFAEMLARDNAERPSIKYNEAGQLLPASMSETFAIAKWFADLKLYGVREKGGGVRLYTIPEIALLTAAGRRIGLDPFAAMENIALVNNRTSLWGKGIRGVLMASGQVEDWQEERRDITDGVCGENGRVTVTIKRKGVPTAFVGSFSVAQAEQAGLWVSEEDTQRNPGLRHSSWWKYPADMLTWRAVGRAALGFADILGGLRIVEDADEEQPRPPKPAENLTRALADMPDPGKQEPEQKSPPPEPLREATTTADGAPAPTKPIRASVTGDVIEPAADRLAAVIGKRRTKRGSQHSAADLLNGTGSAGESEIDPAMNKAKPGWAGGGAK